MLKCEILTFKDTFQDQLVGGYCCLLWFWIVNVYILVECCIVKQQDSCSFSIENVRSF